MNPILSIGSIVIPPIVFMTAHRLHGWLYWLFMWNGFESLTAEAFAMICVIIAIAGNGIAFLWWLFDGVEIDHIPPFGLPPRIQPYEPARKK